MSAKRFACWHCGAAMKRKALVCRACKKLQPGAVKVQTAFLTKARGVPPKPVPVRAPVKPPRPRCPNPSCGKKGGRTANTCARCGTPFSPVHSAIADKAAADYQARLQGSPEWWRRKALAQIDPGEREQMRAEAAKAAGFYPGASAIVKAAGARSLAEAAAAESDPHAREIMRQIMEGGY